MRLSGQWVSPQEMDWSHCVTGPLGDPSLDTAGKLGKQLPPLNMTSSASVTREG